MKRPKWLALPRFEHHESFYLTYIVALALADSLILLTFSEFVRETAISQISAVFVTVEGVLIGLTPQIKYKKGRDLVAFFGIVSILVSVLTFAKSTYESLQLGYYSLDVTTAIFKTSGGLFLGFVELYATAIFAPFTPKDPDKQAIKRVAEAW